MIVIKAEVNNPGPSSDFDNLFIEVALLAWGLAFIGCAKNRKMLGKARKKKFKK